MTTDQLSLLEPGPPTSVRRNDPMSSVRAMAELPLRARQEEVLRALRLLQVSATADDVKRCLVEHGFSRERNEVASRLSELAKLGLVRRIGVRKNHRGKSVGTWQLTDEGRRRSAA